MSEHDAGPTTAAAPRPRTALTDFGLWAEPWHFAPRSRAESGDAEGAARRSGAAVPSPRSGD